MGSRSIRSTPVTRTSLPDLKPFPARSCPKRSLFKSYDRHAAAAAADATDNRKHDRFCQQPVIGVSKMFNSGVYEFPPRAPLEMTRGRDFKIGLERTDEEVRKLLTSVIAHLPERFTTSTQTGVS